MRRSIEHRGIVERIDGNVVMVKVERQSACAGCHAKGLCGESGQERIIEVRTPYAKEFESGERVIVALERESMGFMSVVWAYIFPLILLLANLSNDSTTVFRATSDIDSTILRPLLAKLDKSLRAGLHASATSSTLVGINLHKACLRVEL